MNDRIARLPLCLLAAASLALGACGSSSSTPATGSVNMLLSDASTQDWSLIGVKVLSISLIPQGGGALVSVYTAPSPPPVINLVQLDQLGEILGNVQVPAGTYTGASLSISANPGDVLLTVANDPESGFAGSTSPGNGQSVPAAQIQIQGAMGATGSKTVPLTVNFDSPLVVTANQSNALDLEFDLSHPAFIVDHVSSSYGTFWAVNFNGPVRHHPIADITKLVLRHLYGTVTGVASDSTYITITKDFPVHPATTPETAIASSVSLQILADAANGTLFYDLDTPANNQTIKDFSKVASDVAGKYVRIAARYQDNGTLVAVRLYVSSSFDRVWISPEGHVLHVNYVAPSTTGSLVVENGDGQPVTINVDGNTQFSFQKQSMGTGASYLADLVRGFKVHVDVDPLSTASPRPAELVDIEIAHFNGFILSPSSTGFTYARTFVNNADSYTKTLTYISSSTPNGKDPNNGNAIDGFKWWDLTFPTSTLDYGATAISDFVSAAGGSVNFGGGVSLSVFGDSYATWNDPAKANDWSARWSVLVPTPAPLAAVSTAFSSNTDSFAMTAKNISGATPVTVDLSTVSGSATLVYQVDNSGGIVTVSPEDITNPSTLSTVAGYLKPSTIVKVFGVPESNGHLKAYVLFYFTGTAPTP